MAKKRKLHYIKVTTTSIYAFEDWNAESVIKDWFRDYPMDFHHATRDTCRVGNSTLVQSAEEISEKDFAKHAELVKKSRSRMPQKGA